MVWQKVVGHITNHRIRVESKAGNRYPAETPYKPDNELVYKWDVGDLAPDTLWADIDFSGDMPEVRDISTGHPSGGPPTHSPAGC